MSELLFAFVVNSMWQTTLIAGLAIPIARRRFTLLALTLIACVAAPVLTLAPRGGAENATAFVRAGRLVCEGRSENANYHAKFRRVNP
jgi:hypothetical protein